MTAHCKSKWADNGEEGEGWTEQRHWCHLSGRWRVWWLFLVGCLLLWKKGNWFVIICVLVRWCSQFIARAMSLQCTRWKQVNKVCCKTMKILNGRQIYFFMTLNYIYYFISLYTSLSICNSWSKKSIPLQIINHSKERSLPSKSSD